MSDLFDDMIAAQRVYQARLPHGIGYVQPHGERTGDINSFFDIVADEYTNKELTRGVLLLIDNAEMLAVEALEVKDELPWKKHKENYGEALDWDRERVQEEVIDCLHFVVNLLDLAGLGTSEQVREAFFAKHQVNHRRQTEGY